MKPHNPTFPRQSPKPSFLRRAVPGVLALAAAFSLSGCSLLDTVATGSDEAPQNAIADQLKNLDAPLLSRRVNGWQSWPRSQADKPENVIEGRHNWRNFEDASLLAGVDVYGDTLSILAVVNDDHPLSQQREKLVQTQWLDGPAFAGDALQIRLTPLDRGWKPFEATIQFGSDGTDPKMVIDSAPKGEAGPAKDAVVLVERAPGGYEVYVRLTEATEYGLWPFHNTPYSIEMILHDVDGPMTSHCALRSQTITRP